MERALTANGKTYKVSGEWKSEHLKVIFTGEVTDEAKGEVIAKLEYAVPPMAKARLGLDTLEEDIMAAVREDIIRN